MFENVRKKSRSKRRGDAPISIDHTAHFAQTKKGRKWHLNREETKRKMALLKRNALGPSFD
jgi:hypothetical protein